MISSPLNILTSSEEIEKINNLNKRSQMMRLIYQCDNDDLQSLINEIQRHYWEENVRLLTNGFCEDMCIDFIDKTIDYYGDIFQLSDEQFIEIIEALNKAIDFEKVRIGDDYCKYTSEEIKFYGESRILHIDW